MTRFSEKHEGLSGIRVVDEPVASTEWFDQDVDRSALGMHESKHSAAGNPVICGNHHFLMRCTGFWEDRRRPIVLLVHKKPGDGS
jgi:hypothetical protein